MVRHLAPGQYDSDCRNMASNFPVENQVGPMFKNNHPTVIALFVNMVYAGRSGKHIIYRVRDKKLGYKGKR